MPSTQATMNATPLDRARAENNIRMTAAIGIGLTAMPTA
jgi:hypothetical protein